VSYEGEGLVFFNANRGDGSDFRDTTAKTIAFLRELAFIE